MNNPHLILDRLQELVELAKTPQDAPARAGIFAAMRVVTADLDAVARGLQHNHYMLKKIDELRWSIGALVGYAATDDLPAEQHAALALSDLATLHNFFKEAKSGVAKG